MGKTVIVEATWKPSQDQLAAIDSISLLNKTIASCRDRVNGTNDSFLQDYESAINTSIGHISSCYFALAKSNAESKQNQLKEDCDKYAPKTIIDTLYENWWVVGVILVILWFILKSREAQRNSSERYPKDYE
jgi:hypothetical protein